MALIAPKTLDCHTGLEVNLTFAILKKILTMLHRNAVLTISHSKILQDQAWTLLWPPWTLGWGLRWGLQGRQAGPGYPQGYPSPQRPRLPAITNLCVQVRPSNFPNVDFPSSLNGESSQNLLNKIK